MAAPLIKCRTCGTEIARTAKTCPKCGAPNSEGIGCLGVGAIALFAFFLVGVVCSTLDKTKPEDDPIRACVEAHAAVEARLKAPASATFSSCIDGTARKQPDGTWGVGGYVDSQNSFGAMIRNRWVVKLRPKPSGDWEVQDIVIAP